MGRKWRQGITGKFSFESLGDIATVICFAYALYISYYLLTYLHFLVLWVEVGGGGCRLVEQDKFGFPGDFLDPPVPRFFLEFLQL